MKRIIAILLPALLAAGCAREEYSPSEAASFGGKFTFTFGVTPMAGDGTTKSSFKPMTDDKATSIYMLAYRDGVLDESKSGYFVPASSARADFDNGDVYNLYFLKNTTKFIGDDWTAGELDLHSEANLAQLTYSIESYAVFNETGFPQAGAFPNWVAGDSPTHFDLDRQVARVILKLNDLNQNNVHLTVKSVTLHQAARKIRPFGASFAASSKDDIITEDMMRSDADAADHASADDILVLQGKGEVLLYMLENMQGELLPGNTDHWNKIPKYIQMSEDPAISSKADLVTYVDINCSATTQASVVGDIHYSICLGDNTTTNFDIHRNYENSLDVTYVTDNIIDHEWKQTSQDHQRNGVYYIAGRDTTTRPICICPGISDQVVVACNGRDNFIKIDPSRTTFTGDTDGVSYSITKDGDNYLVSFSTTRTYDNDYAVLDMGAQAPYTEATLTFYSKDAYNGVSNASCKIPVRIYNCIFPIQFRYNRKNGYLEARSNNPMGLGFSIQVAYRLQHSGTNTILTQNFINGKSRLSSFGELGQGPLDLSWKKIGYVGENIDSSSFKYGAGWPQVRMNINITPYTCQIADDDDIILERPYFKDGATLYNGGGKVSDINPDMAFNTFSAETGTNQQKNISIPGYISGNDGAITWGWLTDGFGNMDGLYIRGSGNLEYRLRQQQSVRPSASNFLSCPFYVANADIKYCDTIGTEVHDIGSGDTRVAILKLNFYEPGRDLFPWYSGQRPGYSYVHYGWLSRSIWAKKQLFNIHLWVGSESEYNNCHSEIFVLINGKTQWPLANRTAKGMDSEQF